jgi:uncharacterized membrane protein
VSFAIYIVGFVILIGGLAYGASMAGISTQWIVVGVLVLLGMGVAMGATRTRQKDPRPRATTRSGLNAREASEVERERV